MLPGLRDATLRLRSRQADGRKAKRRQAAAVHRRIRHAGLPIESGQIPPGATWSAGLCQTVIPDHATSRALGFFLAIVRSFNAACRGRRVPCSQLRTAFGLTFR